MKRDRQILDAAAELFTSRGFAGVGVDEIGARVGVSGPAIYHHFAGKDAILARLFTEGLDDLLAVARSSADGDPADDLELMIRTHVAFTLERRDLIALFERDRRSLHGAARRTVEQRMREYAARWEEALRRRFPAAAPADIRCGAQAAIGLIHSSAGWPPDVLGRPDIAEVVCRLVLGGLGGLSPAGHPRGGSGGGAPSG
jgi:AcrR family transcriptional regulator